MCLSRLVHEWPTNYIYVKKGDVGMKFDLATWKAHLVIGGLLMEESVTLKEQPL